ncbi:MAG: hypothetical protein JWM19_886 [Actinomycetia bacterium]|nr:hypothetical protein [Actinomycetes bacterium]
MSHVMHDAVIVVAAGYAMRGGMTDVPVPDVEAFRVSLPADWQRLVVGPVRSVVNDYETWTFLPDGSKEGWEKSEVGDELRKRFAALFSFSYEDGSSPFEVLHVRFGKPEGDDEPEVTVTRNPQRS